jgi:hypothetical protein
MAMPQGGKLSVETRHSRENGKSNVEVVLADTDGGIPADKLEKIAWDKTQAVLAKPEIILKQLAETNSTASVTAIEGESKALKRKLKRKPIAVSKNGMM